MHSIVFCTTTSQQLCICSLAILRRGEFRCNAGFDTLLSFVFLKSDCDDCECVLWLFSVGGWVPFVLPGLLGPCCGALGALSACSGFLPIFVLVVCLSAFVVLRSALPGGCVAL